MTKYLLIEMTDYTLLALAGNIAVNITLAALYYYRIKIETKQIRIMEENALSRKYLKLLQKHIQAEKEEIIRMSPQELREFLDELASEDFEQNT